MIINTDNTVSVTEAEQDFTKVARMADEQGSVVIAKNGRPRYLLIEFAQAEDEDSLPDDTLAAVSARIIEQNRKAYEELAK